MFCHFAVDNVHDTTLTEALKHPLFEDIRNAIPYDGNHLRPCMLIDRPWVFRNLAEKHDAEPTHPGAETLVTGLSDALDQRAEEWAEIADEAWENGDYMELYPYPSENESPVPDCSQTASRETADVG